MKRYQLYNLDEVEYMKSLLEQYQRLLELLYNSPQSYDFLKFNSNLKEQNKRLSKLEDTYEKIMNNNNLNHKNSTIDADKILIDIQQTLKSIQADVSQIKMSLPNETNTPDKAKQIKSQANLSFQQLRHLINSSESIQQIPTKHFRNNTYKFVKANRNKSNNFRPNQVPNVKSKTQINEQTSQSQNVIQRFLYSFFKIK
ncbi:hypothetical protein E3U55_12620 [Filobacillus milosensis]|uniref:Uncharacterized protein n=1 Tax=Filobacillus milosensis TaxID=94137 RepID=A0A4Y8IHA2_9BACI|nr:hypothetical protein [Filobacillus milosensis]TFB15089.1 hypothetical protein E3U55_12620 [Filobacillus milosensis]